MITNKWWEYMLRDAISHIDKCIVELSDNTKHTFDIYKSNIDVVNRKVFIDVYIQDELYGKITKKYLVDKDGNELDIKETDIDKDEEGLYIRFGYQFIERESEHEQQ